MNKGQTKSEILIAKVKWNSGFKVIFYFSIMIKTESAGGVVLNQHRQVLIVSQHGTSWSLPKGHINPNEEKLNAAKREIYEESGVAEVIFIKELGSYARYRIGGDGGEDHSELKTISMFLFTTPQITLKPLDPENPEARWVEIDRVANLLSHPRDKEFFLSIVDNLVSV